MTQTVIDKIIELRFRIDNLNKVNSNLKEKADQYTRKINFNKDTIAAWQAEIYELEKK